MEFIIYALIFLMGSFIGSFTTLAVYRIPLGQDILYTHSYCPNCKKKLSTLDLIPIASYLMLRGKCRQCGEKIRIRYLLLEIFSGIIMLLFVISTGFNPYQLDINLLINTAFYVIFITTLVIIAGIDKEKRQIQKSVLVFGAILGTIFIIYEFCTKGILEIYPIIILGLMLISLLKMKDYKIKLLTLILYTAIWLNPKLIIINMAILFFASLIYTKITKKSEKEMQAGFYFSVIAITTLIASNFIN